MLMPMPQAESTPHQREIEYHSPLLHASVQQSTTYNRFLDLVVDLSLGLRAQNHDFGLKADLSSPVAPPKGGPTGTDSHMAP